MHRPALVAIGVLALSLVSGCSSRSGGSGAYREGQTTPSGEPAYITIQHCLIGFQGSVPGKAAFRTEAEAEQLAQELFAKAQAGENFTKIVATHTDDSPPGIYRIANDGFPGDMTSRVPSKQVQSRSQMVRAFGDTGFALQVGEVGLASYDSETSPFGWHIIKRLK
ncbi:MAG: peptidylprolyl isomerase [Pirellulaceae bacterium]|nr:peptidylprolyl isomerase [Pirellulaceae bacterium]